MEALSDGLLYGNSLGIDRTGHYDAHPSELLAMRLRHIFLLPHPLKQKLTYQPVVGLEALKQKENKAQENSHTSLNGVFASTVNSSYFILFCLFVK